MSETMKRVQITALVNVTLTVDVDIVSGEVDIVSVVGVASPPDRSEVMEALDAQGDLSQLDDAYVEAGGELP